jgi:hypothetical protein
MSRRNILESGHLGKAKKDGLGLLILMDPLKNGCEMS